MRKCGRKSYTFSYSSRYRLQPLKVILTIRVTAKNNQPLIAQTDHMVNGPGKSTLGFRAAVPHMAFTICNAI